MCLKSYSFKPLFVFNFVRNSLPFNVANILRSLSLYNSSFEIKPSGTSVSKALSPLLSTSTIFGTSFDSSSATPNSHILERFIHDFGITSIVEHPMP